MMPRHNVRKARSWGIGVAAAALAVASAGARAGDPADVPEAARWVSADAVVYLELPRPAALVERLTDERLRGPLQAIPPVKAALEKEQFRKLAEVADAVARKLGTTREKALRDLTGGGGVFAVEAGQQGPPGAFLVVTPTDPALLAKANDALIALAREDAADKGNPDPVTVREYRGLTGYQVGKAVYGIVKDRLVIADRAETGKAVADRALDGLGGKKRVTELPEWSSRAGAVKPDTVAWAFARLDRLREIDPNFRKRSAESRKPPETILFGGWLDAVRKAPGATASLDWSDGRLAFSANLSVPPGGREPALKGYLPPKGLGAPGLANTPGTIASLGLWRDLAAVWEARADLLPPQEVQNLAKLDTFAGQFFGGRDFGTGVLGALGTDWRLVVALQDYPALSPAPDVKLPAFALVMDLKPDDDDFPERLRVAFQSFIGLANLGSAQTKAPPLELGSETFEGVTISTARFMRPAKKLADGKDATKEPAKDKEPVHYRHNYSPSAAQVGQRFILSSSVGLTRDLISALKSPGKAPDATLAAEADGAALARLVDLNRNRLVMQNMLEKGHDKDQGEGEVGLLAALLRYLGYGRLSIQDAPDATRVGLEFRLGK
jgi:hypothetical protein